MKKSRTPQTDKIARATAIIEEQLAQIKQTLEEMNLTDKIEHSPVVAEDDLTNFLVDALEAVEAAEIKMSARPETGAATFKSLKIGDMVEVFDSGEWTQAVINCLFPTGHAAGTNLGFLFIDADYQITWRLSK